MTVPVQSVAAPRPLTVQISTADPRSIRALRVLATADRWQHGRLKGSGRKFYAVPSERDPHRLYMVDTRECTCVDFTRSGLACKHVLAVRLHVASVRGERTRLVGPVDTERARLARTYDALVGADQ